MRILFDARGVQPQSDGLSNYIRHLLTALLRVDRDNEYVILLRPSLQAELATAGVLPRPNVQSVVCAIPFMGLPQQWAVPLLARRLPRADVSRMTTS